LFSRQQPYDLAATTRPSLRAMVSAMEPSAQNASIANGESIEGGKSARFSVTRACAWAFSAAAKHAGHSYPANRMASGKHPLCHQRLLALTASSGRPRSPFSRRAIAPSVLLRIFPDHLTRKDSALSARRRFLHQRLTKVYASVTAA
jgi:hypothetical protein